MKLELIREKLAILIRVSEEIITMDLHANMNDAGTDWILRTIIREYHARTGDQIKYPSNWKEAIKERFAPRWFLKRWPVRYDTLERFIAFPEFDPPDKLGRYEYEIIKRTE